MGRGLGATALVKPSVSLGWSFFPLYSSCLSRRANFKAVLILFLPLSGVPPCDPFLSVVHNSVPPPSPSSPARSGAGGLECGERKRRCWQGRRDACPGEEEV